MEKLKMHSPNLVDEHIEKIAALFPNVVTEVLKDGKATKAIDFDLLRQELSDVVVEGPKERYQFTWPDKRQSILKANAPISKTLRPCREESVDFDTTENLYIEGDNLDALKLLQKTYLGKVKMIYIDPPYNTGHDFVYRDDFSESVDEYLDESGQFDEAGNRLVANLESNGRFHTDWLNMMYPRLKLAKNLLSEDGVIFISIDDKEEGNLKKICDEVFGIENFAAIFPWRKRTAKSDVPFGISQDYEWIMVYAKSDAFKASVKGNERKYYESDDFPGRPWRIHDLTKQTTASERPNSYFTIVNPKNGKEYPANPNRTWAITKETFDEYYKVGRIVFPDDYDFLNIKKPVLRYWKEDDVKKAGDSFGRSAVSTKLIDGIGMSQDGTKEITNLFESKVFAFPKPSSLIKYFLDVICDDSAIVLDFFSGSATTAHAVMQLNAEDGGRRKFIMVQLPEVCDPKSEAFKAGYENICEIGKERIRRAGRKILESSGKMAPSVSSAADKSSASKGGNVQTSFLEGSGQIVPQGGQLCSGEIADQKQELDIGFRVLKIDSSNMKDVYYKPSETVQMSLLDLADNIKADRTAEDLLFQMMLDLGVDLSAKIEREEIDGKRVFMVDGNYLIACFDSNVTDETVKAIAQKEPYFAVFRDSGFATDSTAANCEQLFNTYSPATIRKVL